MAVAASSVSHPDAPPEIWVKAAPYAVFDGLYEKVLDRYERGASVWFKHEDGGWLYKDEDGAWRLVGSEASMEKSLGWIRSAKRSKSPEEVQDWEWFDGENWSVSPDIRLTTQKEVFDQWLVDAAAKTFRHLWVRLPHYPFFDGLYEKITDRREHGLPVWLQLDGGGCLYSSKGGKWFFADSEDKIVDNIGSIQSGTKHGGQMPEEIWEWEWFDGEEWRTTAYLRIATSEETYNQWVEEDQARAVKHAATAIRDLWVVSPMHEELEGHYEKEVGRLEREAPVWLKVGGGGCLHSGANGCWVISGAEEHISIDFAQIASIRMHGGEMPDEMQTWEWYNGEQWSENLDIRVTDLPPRVRAEVDARRQAEEDAKRAAHDAEFRQIQEEKARKEADRRAKLEEEQRRREEEKAQMEKELREKIEAEIREKAEAEAREKAAVQAKEEAEARAKERAAAEARIRKQVEEEAKSKVAAELQDAARPKVDILVIEDVSSPSSSGAAADASAEKVKATADAATIFEESVKKARDDVAAPDTVSTAPSTAATSASAAEELKKWLFDLDGKGKGRYVKYEATMLEQYGSLRRVAEAAKEGGTESVLETCQVKNLDKLKFRVAVERLVSELTGAGEGVAGDGHSSTGRRPSDASYPASPMGSKATSELKAEAQSVPQVPLANEVQNGSNGDAAPAAPSATSAPKAEQGKGKSRRQTEADKADAPTKAGAVGAAAGGNLKRKSVPTAAPQASEAAAAVAPVQREAAGSRAATASMPKATAKTSPVLPPAHRLPEQATPAPPKESPSSSSAVGESLGTYTIVFEGLPVKTQSGKDGEKVAALAKGTVVRVVEISPEVVAGQIRARIDSPAGWISLCKVSGKRFADKGGKNFFTLCLVCAGVALDPSVSW